MSSLHRSLEMERSSYNLTCGSIRLTILGNGKEKCHTEKKLIWKHNFELYTIWFDWYELMKHCQNKYSFIFIQTYSFNLKVKLKPNLIVDSLRHIRKFSKHVISYLLVWSIIKPSYISVIQYNLYLTLLKYVFLKHIFFWLFYFPISWF